MVLDMPLLLLLSRETSMSLLVTFWIKKAKLQWMLLTKGKFFSSNVNPVPSSLLHTCSANKIVAAYKHTDVTKYKDLLGLFELAEKTFGGVDVSFFSQRTSL